MGRASHDDDSSSEELTTVAAAEHDAPAPEAGHTARRGTRNVVRTGQRAGQSVTVPTLAASRRAPTS